MYENIPTHFYKSTADNLKNIYTIIYDKYSTELFLQTYILNNGLYYKGYRRFSSKNKTIYSEDILDLNYPLPTDVTNYLNAVDNFISAMNIIGRFLIKVDNEFDTPIQRWIKLNITGICTNNVLFDKAFTLPGDNVERLEKILTTSPEIMKAFKYIHANNLLLGAP